MVTRSKAEAPPQVQPIPGVLFIEGDNSALCQGAAQAEAAIWGKMVSGAHSTLDQERPAPENSTEDAEVRDGRPLQRTVAIVLSA